MDDVSRIHIPKNMVPFAENLDQVVLPSPSRGETVLDRCVGSRAVNEPLRSFTITEKAPTRAFSLLKGSTSAFTIKNILRHYLDTMLN